MSPDGPEENKGPSFSLYVFLAVLLISIFIVGLLTGLWSLPF